jgi:hypothetical protein
MISDQNIFGTSSSITIPVEKLELATGASL